MQTLSIAVCCVLARWWRWVVQPLPGREASGSDA